MWFVKRYRNERGNDANQEIEYGVDDDLQFDDNMDEQQYQSRLAQLQSRLSSLLPSRDNDEEYEQNLQEIIDDALPVEDDGNDNNNSNRNDNDNENEPQQSPLQPRRARINALRQRVQSIGQQAIHRLRV